VHQKLNKALQSFGLDLTDSDNPFYVRALTSIDDIHQLYQEIYQQHPQAKDIFQDIINSLIRAHTQRSAAMKKRDAKKADQVHWYLSNELAGMSLYVDRFCGNLKTLSTKLDYCENLGVNLLHLMPIFESPEGESDGGYAVSDFQKVEKRFGTLADLKMLQKKLDSKDMYLMLDIVLNHTSHKHAWAEAAKAGNKKYQDFYYMYPDRTLPDQFDAHMPEIFPESSPGNFTYIKECQQWVMSIFHHYQWDLNYSNPAVFHAMLENILFFANLGVDVLRIDAPAFIWKELGTTCQNLPQAHTLLRLIKQCIQVAAPGMAILGEAIVAPKEIMKYFGTGTYTARECDFAYNATHMALQWDMLATGDTRVMLAAQHEILQKPYGTTWLTYTRCHDDIGLGYEDYMIQQAGFDPFQHRQFLKDYYAGNFKGSPSTGALFSSNPKTGDARISGSLASLCGLEKAIQEKNSVAIDMAIQKILLMQAHSFFLGGVPMLFYGDELGYTNDYSYLNDSGRSYDNRWMHRPVIDWDKNNRVNAIGTIEHTVFSATKKLLALRATLTVVSDLKNLTWINTANPAVAGYLRTHQDERLYCIFNFSATATEIYWRAFKEHGISFTKMQDLYSGITLSVGADAETLKLKPYQFLILQVLE
jgi:amylosucrase